MNNAFKEFIESINKQANILIRLANSLDKRGFIEEANFLDQIIIEARDFSNLEDTNITKDEAFAAGYAVALEELGNEDEAEA